MMKQLLHRLFGYRMKISWQNIGKCVDKIFDAVMVLVVLATGVANGLSGNWQIAVLLALLLANRFVDIRTKRLVDMLKAENARLWDMAKRDTDAMKKAIAELDLRAQTIKTFQAQGLN